jgi:hypothetical protein
MDHLLPPWIKAGPYLCSELLKSTPPDATFPAQRLWTSNTAIITIHFDENGIVDEDRAALARVEPAAEGLFDKLRRWLRL